MLKIDKYQLVELINKGFSLKSIAEKLNISYSTINRLCNKYELKSKFNEFKNELVNCVECDLEFNGNIKEVRKFCSRSCSTTYNNKVKTITEDTKLKISNTLKNKNKKLIKIRLCKNCNNVVGSKKIICDSCRLDYYEYYRPSSNFNFDINLYKDRFDISLVGKYGWYSPSNKGNNLDGVSKDHMFSVKDGFVNKISIDIIKHPANCRLMIHRDNQVKNSKSVITLEELLKRIEEWNKWYSV
jgi:hypothetical protein